MRTADPVVFDNLVRAGSTEPQLQVFMPQLKLVLSVHHRPLVQTEAAELGRTCGGTCQDDLGKNQGLTACGEKRLPVEGHGGAARRNPA